MPTVPWPEQRIAESENLRGQLRAEQEQNLLLTESLADLQLALEDKGWQSLKSSVDSDFTPEGRKALVQICRTMSASNPLIKRGLLLRTGYIWGQGVEVRALAAGDDNDQDVNAVVQDFLDANTGTLTGNDAQTQNERCLGTDGNVYLACFTNPLTGTVRVRASLAEEVVDIITNPDDRDEDWYYVRQVPRRVVEPGTSPSSTRTRNELVKVAHPAVGFYPKTRPKTLDGMPVRWDAPILHIKVNVMPGARFGIPDVYASIAWARAYKDFLVDWAQLARSLSKFAWQATGGTASRAQKIAQGIARSQAAQGAGAMNPVPPVGAPGQAPAGQTAVGTPDVRLEAISKSGATIDSNSGKPLAGMAAAGMGVPVTMLLADPGVTGARAVAETLDLPTALEMGLRRLLWQAKLTELLDYVVDQAVIAPRGPLRGSMVRDEWGKLSTVLAGDAERTLDWTWPPLLKQDPAQLVTSIVSAIDTGLIPDLTSLSLLLNALGVSDVDEILAQVTDEDGNFIDTRAAAARAAVEAWRRGEDPARAVRG